LSIPAIVGFFLIQSLDQISVYFVAQTNNTVELAGIGLGNMMNVIVPYSVMIGVNTALETFVSRAAGRNNLRDCGLYLHRSMFIICCLFIPVSLVQMNSARILQALGIEKESSDQACVYVTTMLPAALVNSFNEAIELFLIPLGYTYSICLI
jgi:Na+-driven multidrug efflux pump